MVISFDSNSPSRHGNSRSPLLDDCLDRWTDRWSAADGLRIVEDPPSAPPPRVATSSLPLDYQTQYGVARENAADLYVAGYPALATLSLAGYLCELLSTLLAVETGTSTSDTFIADLQVFNERVAAAFPRT